MRWYILGSLLFFGTLTTWSNISKTEAEHKLARLDQLQQRAIAFDHYTPIDTVIKWGGLLIPYLEQEGRFVESSLIRQLVSVALCEKGFVGMATQMVDTLMQNAQQAQENLCMSIALHSTGKLFASFDLQEQAMETYQKAMELLQTDPPEDPSILKRLLLDMLRTSLRLENLTQTEEIIDELNPYISNRTSDPLFPLYLIHKSRYAILLKDPDEAQSNLDWAKLLLNTNHLQKGSTTVAYYHFVVGLLYELEDAYEPALQEFQSILPGIVSTLTAGRWNEVSAAASRILEKMGKPEIACKLMRDIISRRDSINSINNATQINTLRTKYQIADYAVKSRQQSNTLLLWIVIVLAGIAVILVCLTIYLNYLSKKLVAKQYVEERQRAEAESSTFTKNIILSNMSHEIRTPLNALTGFAAILADQHMDDSVRRQSIDIIRRNSELLIKLIDDIINLSNMEFGRMEFRFAVEDAVTICNNVIETFDHIKHSNVQIIFRSEMPSVLIETDRARLQQVLINLLSNATKYTREGTITLELTQYSEGFLQFTVTDTGSGILPQYQKKIFNRFEKLDELKPGVGLGLSICRLIITQIGGRIWLDPEYKNGARFCFTHPIAQKTNTIVRP